MVNFRRNAYRGTDRLGSLSRTRVGNTDRGLRRCGPCPAGRAHLPHALSRRLGGIRRRGISLMEL
eukprot:10218194-Lingulodinium_polyedra.AAC.1